MNKLFARQIEKATDANGVLDLERLGELVVEAYETVDRDRRRTDRSIGLMIEELDALNSSLERQVVERTAALSAREAELSAQNLRFDAAINNMSQALLMFDENARLVIHNDRYLEMYGLKRGTIGPGLSLLELIEMQVKGRTLVGDPLELAENVLAASARRRATSWLNELPDGRTISVRLHPIADGGWVTTHEDISDRRDAERRIAHMVRHDTLTDLPNRVMLRERLGEALAQATAKEHVAVLYLDVDQFKAVNDDFGHTAGDELLKALAARLCACVDDRTTVARIGGDEFAIVRMNVSAGGSEAAALAVRICEALGLPFQVQNKEVVVETSIGISVAADDTVDPGELIKNAELALQRAKLEGRGLVRFFEPEMDERMKARRSLEAALRNALATGEFRLYYQPVVNLSDGRITGCEALIRWHHPERGEISPAEFIPIAEEMGLIVPLGEWVLRQACADACHWPDDVRVAVNLSPIQLLNPRLVPVVLNALASGGIAASRLEIEITETALMQNTETTLSALHRLHSLGIRISMDDFGTGYSSLSNLRSFPFDKIKIDRSFISGLPDREDSVAIVRAVASLAASLNMITTAEGVETAAQMDRVRKLGCTEMQGFYFSRARPVEFITRLLAADAVRPAMSA
ncbi:MAG: EAL domain-containing protein [Bauldia sp.]